MHLIYNITWTHRCSSGCHGVSLEYHGGSIGQNYATLNIGLASFLPTYTFFYDVRNIINILTRVGKTIILTVYHLLTFLNHKTKFILTNNLIYGYKIIPKIHKNSNIHSTDAVTKQN